MKKSKILSVMYLTEFIVREGDTLVLIRHSNGQPLRICKLDEVSTTFMELLDDFKAAVSNSTQENISA